MFITLLNAVNSDLLNLICVIPENQKQIFLPGRIWIAPTGHQRALTCDHIEGLKQRQLPQFHIQHC